MEPSCLDTEQVIYQVVTDRFFDGDKVNDNPPQSYGLFDPTQTNREMYWGGDFQGIQDKLSYLAGMGITAIWISPPVDNINVPLSAMGQSWAGYHGYLVRDMKRIEEHFGNATNGWPAFDRLVQAARRHRIKVIVDFTPNFSNSTFGGDYGDLYDDGKLLADYRHDTYGYLHHNGAIKNWNDPYQIQYYDELGVADLNQMNPTIDSYLKTAAEEFQRHGIEEFRIDSAKHVSWGWLYSFTDTLLTHSPAFVFGEWYMGGQDPLYRDALKFANQSGMSLLGACRR